MNFQHGFYSKSEYLNPDSIMMNNAVLGVKQMLLGYQGPIKSF